MWMLSLHINIICDLCISCCIYIEISLLFVLQECLQIIGLTFDVLALVRYLVVCHIAIIPILFEGMLKFLLSVKLYFIIKCCVMV